MSKVTSVTATDGQEVIELSDYNGNSHTTIRTDRPGNSAYPISPMLLDPTKLYEIVLNEVPEP